MASNTLTTPMQFCDALRSLSRVKSLFAFLIVLCLLVQLAAFVLVSFVGVLDNDAVSADGNSAMNWFKVINWSLASTKFIALVSALLLMLTVMFSVKVSLVGRVGATAGFLGAFFWSLVLLAMLVPWQQMIGSAMACGATFNLQQLAERGHLVRKAWGATEESATAGRWVVYYLRFLVYPVMAFFVQMIVLAKFSRGFRPLRAGAYAAPEPAFPVSDVPAESSSIEV